MRCLTVQQPWATAIIWWGKSPENRSRNLAGSYRGPVAIHAGLTVDEAAYDDDMIREALGRYDDGWLLEEQVGTVGAFIGVVDLVDVHNFGGHACSSPWSERDAVHLVLANPRPLARPIPARGRLGLWTPPPDTLDALEAVL